MTDRELVKRIYLATQDRKISWGVEWEGGAIDVLPESYYAATYKGKKLRLNRFSLEADNYAILVFAPWRAWKLRRLVQKIEAEKEKMEREKTREGLERAI
jgi:hypothetical protein